MSEAAAAPEAAAYIYCAWEQHHWLQPHVAGPDSHPQVGEPAAASNCFNASASSKHHSITPSLCTLHRKPRPSVTRTSKGTGPRQLTTRTASQLGSPLASHPCMQNTMPHNITRPFGPPLTPVVLQQLTDDPPPTNGTPTNTKTVSQLDRSFCPTPAAEHRTTCRRQGMMPHKRQAPEAYVSQAAVGRKPTGRPSSHTCRSAPGAS